MAMDLTQMYTNTFYDSTLENIPVKLRGLVAQNSLDQMYIIFQEKVVPGGEIEEGEVGQIKYFYI